MFKKSAPGQ